MAVTVVVAYDIESDRRRAHVAGLLQRYGDRIQMSVFLCRFDDDDYVLVYDELRRLIDVKADSIYFVAQCQDCWGKVKLLGQAKPPERGYFYSAW